MYGGGGRKNLTHERVRECREGGGSDNMCV